jgi:hypothetical protein
MDDRRTDRRHRLEERPLSRERRMANRRKLALGAGLLASMAAATPRALSFARSLRTSAPVEVEVSTSSDFRLPALNREALDAVIGEASAAYGVSPDLVKAVIQTESQFDPMAVSPVGALGLMQLMPVTAAYLGVADPFDPRQNVNGGVKYLSMLLDRFNGNVALALAGYNAGPTAVARHRGIPPFRETRGYVQKIRALVSDTTSAFSIPEPRRPKTKASARRVASARAKARAASAKRQSVKMASLRSAAKRSSARATVRNASMRKAAASRVRSKATAASASKARGARTTVRSVRTVRRTR